MTVRISGTNYGKRYPPEGGAAALPPPNPQRARVEKRFNGEVMETKEQKASGSIDSTGGSATNGAAQVKEPTAAAMPRAPAPITAIEATPQASDSGSAANANGSARPHAPENLAEVSPAVLAAPRGYPAAWASGEASAWLAAYESIQYRTAEAHAIYQQTMAQCHLAFLRAAEQSALALASVAVGSPAVALSAPRAGALPAPLPAAPLEALATGAPMMQAPAAFRSPRPAPAPAMPRAPAPRPSPAPSPPSTPPAELRIERPAAPAPGVARAPASAPPAPAPSAPPPVAPSAPPAPAVAPEAKTANGIPMPADGDLKSYLFAIVSEKTGYPVDILNLDQQLEADLGIDSIKRVEILSAFEGQIPDIKDVNLEEVTKLATLRDVLGFMERYADKLGLTKKKESRLRLLRHRLSRLRMTPLLCPAA
jgi:acyl carrier protein